MPELPEVETVRRNLATVLPGRRVEAVEVRSPHCLAEPDPELFRRSLTGRTIRGVGRRGKYLLLDLDGGFVLAVHLRMTGRLVYEVPGTGPAAAGETAPDPHTHAVLRLSGGGRLSFRDVRKFGRLYLTPSLSSLLPAGKLGPEPLEEGFTPEALASRLKGRQARVKAMLLDQRVVAGVGNIYADEALFLAGIHPERRAGSLRKAEVERLHAAVRQVLEEGIRHRGTTFSDYRDGFGEPGGYGERLAVYGREGAPCRRCGGPVSRIRSGGRSSYFCPACQRPPRTPQRRKKPGQGGNTR